MSDFGPQIRLTRLFERKSKTGNVYFAGRLGNAKIAVLKSKDTSDDGAPIWDVLLTEASPRPAVQSNVPVGSRNDVQAPLDRPARGNFDKKLDDEIPF